MSDAKPTDHLASEQTRRHDGGAAPSKPGESAWVPDGTGADLEEADPTLSSIHRGSDTGASVQPGTEGGGGGPAPGSTDDSTGFVSEEAASVQGLPSGSPATSRRTESHEGTESSESGGTERTGVEPVQTVSGKHVTTAATSTPSEQTGAPPPKAARTLDAHTASGPGIATADGVKDTAETDPTKAPIDSTADAPTLGLQDASGAEDTAIALDIAAALVDTDGSESLAVTVSGVPAGATLSAGTDNGDGSWTLTPGQLNGLTITPPADADGDFSLTVTATSTEANGGDIATTVGTLDVTVGAVADTPTLSLQDATGAEDTAIALDIAAALVDTDGSESLSVTVSGVPTGATLSAGTDNGDGSWTLTPDQLNGLTITPPVDADGDFSLTVAATSTEANGGDIATTVGTLDVTVLGEPDKVGGLNLWLDAADSATVIDTGSDGDLDQWLDKSSHANHATQTSGFSQPIIENGAINGQTALKFDGANDYLRVANSGDLNVGGPYTGKTLTMAFQSGADVTSRQVIYEQGAGVRGLNVYIDGGELYVNGWNLAEQQWGPHSVSTSISAGSTYVVSLVYDGVGGAVTGYINGVEIGSVPGAGTLYNHGGAIGFGAMNNGTYFHDGAAGGNGFYFDGYIGEAAFYDHALTDAERSHVENFLTQKWIDPSENTTISGTSDADTLDASGSIMSHTISGLDGNDTITGGSGADVLSGGRGDDALFGDLGDDTLDGGSGSDELHGGAGADTLLGGTADGTGKDTEIGGNDLLYGEAGDDLLDGGDGNDQLFGGDGIDTLLGGVGADQLYGGAGADQLDGGAGNDVIYGDAGDDTLVGGAGADELRGGTGDDTLRVDASDTVIDGGAGNDRVEVVGSDGVTVDMAAGSIETAIGGAGDDRFDASGATTQTTQYGGAGNDSLNGGDGNDDLRGEAGNDTLRGGAGDDTLAGGAGNDSAYGDAGNDMFVFAPGDGLDTFSGGVGWTDAVELAGVSGDFTQGDWTLALDSGSAIQSQGADSLTLTDDAAGTITLTDGSVLIFDGVETIQW